MEIPLNIINVQTYPQIKKYILQTCPSLQQVGILKKHYINCNTWKIYLQQYLQNCIKGSLPFAQNNVLKFKAETMSQFDFMAQFRQEFGLGQKKASNPPQTDFLSSLLAATKQKQQVRSREVPKTHKKEQDLQNTHQYFKRAQKPLKDKMQKTKLFDPKNGDKQVKFQQKMKQVRKEYEIKNKQKKYKPKIVDYLGVGQWQNYKKKGDDKPKASSTALTNRNKQRQSNDKSKPRKYSQDEKKSHPDRQRQRDHEKNTQRRQQRQSRQNRNRIQSQKPRRYNKQKQTVTYKERERDTQKSRDKQRQRARSYNDRNIKQKQRQRSRQKDGDKQRSKQRQRRQRDRQKQRQRRQRDRQIQRRQRHKQKNRHNDDDDYQDDGFVVDDQEQEDPNWRKQLNKITRNQEKRKIFEERDKMKIEQSTASRILGEDRISARFGRMQEEDDMRRQQEEMRRKKRREN